MTERRDEGREGETIALLVTATVQSPMRQEISTPPNPESTGAGPAVKPLMIDGRTRDGVKATWRLSLNAVSETNGRTFLFQICAPLAGGLAAADPGRIQSAAAVRCAFTVCQLKDAVFTLRQL